MSQWAASSWMKSLQEKATAANANLQAGIANIATGAASLTTRKAVTPDAHGKDTPQPVQAQQQAPAPATTTHPLQEPHQEAVAPLNSSSNEEDVTPPAPAAADLRLPVSSEASNTAMLPPAPLDTPPDTKPAPSAAAAPLSAPPDTSNASSSSSHPLAPADTPQTGPPAAPAPVPASAPAPTSAPAPKAPTSPTGERSSPEADAATCPYCTQYAELVKDSQDQVLLEVKRRRSVEAYAEKCKAETRQVSDQLDKARQEVVRLEAEASTLSTKYDALRAERDKLSVQTSAGGEQDTNALEAAHKRMRILEQRLDEAQDTATRGILKMQELEKSLSRSEQERLETAAELKILQSKLKTTIDRNVELTETSYHAEQVVKRFTELEEEMLANREKVKSGEARIQEAMERASAAREAKEAMAKKLAAAEARVAQMEALMEGGGGGLKRSSSVRQEEVEVENGAEPATARLKAKLADVQAQLKASQQKCQVLEVENRRLADTSADAVATVATSEVVDKDPDGSRAHELSQQLAQQLQVTETSLDTAWMKLQEKEQYIAALLADIAALREQLSGCQHAGDAAPPVEVVIKLADGAAANGLGGGVGDDEHHDRDVVVVSGDEGEQVHVAPPPLPGDYHSDAVDALQDELQTLALTLKSFKVQVVSATNPNTPAGSPGMTDLPPATPGTAPLSSTAPGSSSRQAGGQRRGQLPADEMLLSVQAANAELRTLQGTVSVLLGDQQAALSELKTKENQIEDLQGQIERLKGLEAEVVSLTGQLEAASAQVNGLSEQLQAVASGQSDEQQVLQSKVGDLTSQLSQAEASATKAEADNEQLHLQVAELTSQLEQAQTDKAALSAQLQESQPQVAELNSQLEAAQGQVTELRSQLDDAQGQVAELTSQLEQAQADKAALSDQLQESQPQVAELNSQLEAAQGQVTELRSQLDDAQGQVAELTSQLEQAQADKAALSAQLQESQPQVAELNSQLEAAQGQVTELRSQLDDAQGQVAELTSQLEQAQTDQAALSAQLQESQPQVAELNSQLEAAQGQVTELRSQLDGAQGQVAELTSQLDGAQGQVAELASQLEQAQADAAKYKTQLEQAQSHHDPLSAHLLPPPAPSTTAHVEDTGPSDQLSEQLQQSVAEVQSLTVRLQQAEAEAADAHATNTQLQSQIDSLTAELQQSASQVIELTSQLEAHKARGGGDGGGGGGTGTLRGAPLDPLGTISLDADATNDASPVHPAHANSATQIVGPLQGSPHVAELVDVPLMDVSLSPGGSPGMQPLPASGAGAQSLSHHEVGYGALLGQDGGGDDAAAAGATAPEMYWRISYQNLEEKAANQERDHQAQIEKVVSSYQRQLERMEHDHATSMSDYAAVLKAEHDEKLNQLAQECDEKLSQRAQECEALRQAVTKAEEIVQEARSKRDQALQTLQDSQDRNADLEERCKALDGDAKERIERLQRLNKQRAAEVDDLTAQLKTLQPRLDKAEAALAEANKLISKLSAQVAEYKPGSEACAMAEARAAAVESKVVSLTHELEVARAEVDELSAKCSKLRNVSEQKARAEERVKELQVLVEELQQNADDVLEMRRQVHSAEQRRDAAVAEASKSQAMLHNLEHRLAQVEEDNERLSSALDEQLLRQATQQVTDPSVAGLTALHGGTGGCSPAMHTTTTHTALSPANSVGHPDAAPPFAARVLPPVHEHKGGHAFFRSLEAQLALVPVEAWGEWVHDRAVEEGEAQQGGTQISKAKDFTEKWGMEPQQALERMYEAEAKFRDVTKELEDMKARAANTEELLQQELASAADAHRTALQALRAQVTAAEDSATQAAGQAESWQSKARQLEEEVSHIRERSRALLEEQEQKNDKLKAELRALKAARPPLPGSVSEGGPMPPGSTTPSAGLAHYHPASSSPHKPTGVGAYHMYTSSPGVRPPSTGGQSTEIVPIDQLPTLPKTSGGGGGRASDAGMSEADRLKQQVEELRVAYANSVKVQELQEQSQNCLKQELANLKASQALTSQDIGYLRQVLVEGFAKDLLPTDNKLYHVVSSVLKISSQEIENLKAAKATTSSSHTSSPSLWSGLFGGK